jgi:hypothetical protein
MPGAYTSIAILRGLEVQKGDQKRLGVPKKSPRYDDLARHINYLCSFYLARYLKIFQSNSVYFEENVMKKALYILLAFAAVAVAATGCSKKSGGGGTNAYAPASCFNSGYNNGYNNGVPGIQYQWRNGQCVDIQNGQVANQALCNSVNNNYSYNQNCNTFGGNQFWQGGNAFGAYNQCSVYNTAFETFYPVFYAGIGVVCAGYAAYNTMWSYGSPAYYPGYNNVYQGCVPGASSSCHCRSFGGTMGWFYGGVQLGICY